MARPVITSSDLGPLVEVLDWVLLAFIVAAVGGRGAIKLWMIRRLTLDDFLVLGSMVFAIAESICVFLEVVNGLGQHMDTLTKLQVESLQKAQYASKLLYIPALVLAKFGVLAVLRIISPVPAHAKAIKAVGLLISVWALTSELLFAFQCKLPSPWQYTDGTCVDLKAAENYLSVLNLVTEVALLILPCAIIKGLQLPFRRKAAVLAMFLNRVVVTIPIICQLAFFNQAHPADDPSYYAWATVLCMQLVQCLSILCTCMVYIRSFLDSLETGFMRVDDIRRRGESTQEYGLEGSGTTNQASSGSGSRVRAKLSGWGSSHSTKTESGVHLQRLNASSQTKAERQGSDEVRLNTNENAIVQTRSWAVESRTDHIENRQILDCRRGVCASRCGGR